MLPNQLTEENIQHELSHLEPAVIKTCIELYNEGIDYRPVQDMPFSRYKMKIIAYAIDKGLNAQPLIDYDDYETFLSSITRYLTD